MAIEDTVVVIWKSYNPWLQGLTETAFSCYHTQLGGCAFPGKVCVFKQQPIFNKRLFSVQTPDFSFAKLSLS